MLTAPVSLQWPKTVKKIKDSCIKSAHLPFVSESCNILTVILETLDALPFDLENIGAIKAAKWIRTVFQLEFYKRRSIRYPAKVENLSLKKL